MKKTFTFAPAIVAVLIIIFIFLIRSHRLVKESVVLDKSRTTLVETVLPEDRGVKTIQVIDVPIEMCASHSNIQLFKEIALASRIYAGNHDGFSPVQMNELSPYLPSSTLSSTFFSEIEIIKQKQKVPDYMPEVLVFREIRFRKAPNGNVARLYARSDGVVLEIQAINDDETELWEKKFLMP